MANPRSGTTFLTGRGDGDGVHIRADFIWVSVPKKPMAERFRGIEDLIAISLRPANPIERIAVDLMAGLDGALAQDIPAHRAERLSTQMIDLLALTITGAGLPPRTHHVLP